MEKNTVITESKHTEGEWKVRKYGHHKENIEINTTSFNYSTNEICQISMENEHAEANAAYIVKACNNFDSLLHALKLAKAALKEVAPDAYNYGSVGADIDNALQKINE